MLRTAASEVTAYVFDLWLCFGYAHDTTRESGWACLLLVSGGRCISAVASAD